MVFGWFRPYMAIWLYRFCSARALCYESPTILVPLLLTHKVAWFLLLVEVWENFGWFVLHIALRAVYRCHVCARALLWEPSALILCCCYFLPEKHGTHPLQCGVHVAYY